MLVHVTAVSGELYRDDKVIIHYKDNVVRDTQRFQTEYLTIRNFCKRAGILPITA